MRTRHVPMTACSSSSRAHTATSTALCTTPGNSPMELQTEPSGTFCTVECKIGTVCIFSLLSMFSFLYQIRPLRMRVHIISRPLLILFSDVYNQGSFHITLELSDNKWPSASTLPTFWDDNREAILSCILSSSRIRT